VTKNLCVGPALIVFAVNECGAPKLGWIRQKSQREELFVPAVVLKMPKYQFFDLEVLMFTFISANALLVWFVWGFFMALGWVLGTWLMERLLGLVWRERVG
jgi:hypothetical protein